MILLYALRNGQRVMPCDHEVDNEHAISCA